MDDDELQMLQRELMAVQEEKTNPLSERTVAEIMVKLQKNNFPFYVTTDGSEYVTPQCLDRQILDLTRKRGRISITIIPQILNLNGDLVQSRINMITTKSNIIRHNQLLLTPQQLTSIVLSLKQRLQSQGKVQLEEIAVTNEFNMVFLKKIVQQNIEQLNAEMVGNELITKQYTRMQNSRIKGYLNGISRPISIQSLIKNAGFQKNNIESIIENLIQKGQLSGKYQNNYFIPNKFALNQKKTINLFFQNNGYVQFSFLQKNFISKHQQWLSNNLQYKYFIFDQTCISYSKLEDYQLQISALLKGEGLVQISSVIPFQLSQQHADKFLRDSCKLTDFTYFNGYCYSDQWLDKCTLQFKQKIVYNIFFKKIQQSKKKSNKKKIQTVHITEQQLVETLFDGGLAQYSVLQNLAQYLLPLLNSKLEQLKIKCEKELAKNQGIINSAFLKYRRCKTIIKTEENLTRFLNTIEKQKKKSGKWMDPDFGPLTDNNGLYSLLHYDAVLYKTWQPINNLKWISIPPQKLNHSTIKSQYMGKLLLPELMDIINYHNNRITLKQNKIDWPIIETYAERSESPFVYKFYISEKEKRFVVIDEMQPIVNENAFYNDGYYSLVEKAYAKMRYCYKSTLSVGFQQLIFQLTGINPMKLLFYGQTTQNACQSMKWSLKKQRCIIVIGQGEIGKKLIHQEIETQFFSQRPYYLFLKDDNIIIYPSIHTNNLNIQQIKQLFKNLYII